MSHGDKVISLDNVTVQYRRAGSWMTQKAIEHTALEGISFDLLQGQSLAVVGRNGAGKSTLLKLLADVLLPDSGSVVNHGYSTALMALNVGLMPNLSGRDNIFIVGILLGHSRSTVAQHFDEIVEFAELERFLDHPVKTYSAGMKSRLGFAVAATLQADVLLIDEVLAVGDKQFRKKSEQVIRERLQGDQTVVLVSHAENAIRNYCTHALWIEDGQVRMHDEVNRVMDEYEGPRPQGKARPFSGKGAGKGPGAAIPRPQLERFINLAYQHILGRQPDAQGREAYVDKLAAGKLQHADILKHLFGSEEFQAKSGVFNYSNHPAIQRYKEQCEKQLEEALDSCRALSEDIYQRAWAEVFESGKELVIGQAEYGRQHRRRFYELINALILVTEGKPKPRLLEFGVSEFSQLYGQLRPGIQLDCADRPSDADYIGFNAETSLRVSGGKRFFAVDLNAGEAAISASLAAAQGQYDLVLFTEVLEHLTANPVDILRQLLALLAPGGTLYLSTPNFFRQSNLARMTRHDNPQEVYPAGDDNWDAHHHHREYALLEMLEFIDQAGGRTRALQLSDCWDDPKPETTWERGNMVFLIAKKATA